VVQRSIANVLGFGLIALLISGCSTPVKRIEVSTTPVERPKLELPKADELNLKEIDWIVVTEDNYEEVFDKIKSSGRPVALFALTDQGYENISVNFSAIRSYIQQQQAIIIAYKNYYEKSEEALDKANETIDNVKSDVDAQQTENEQQSTGILNIFK
jgi:hypothetical protein